MDAHIIADLSADRATAIRALKSSSELLTDGLHALRNGSPNVADEFMDRAITAITNALEAIA
jgi:hypothetical protein